MTWTKLPDDHGQTEPVIGLSDNAYRLYVQGLIYSNRNLTDGRLPRAAIGTLTPRVLPRSVRELVAGGLWLAQPDSYMIARFKVDQPSKADVEQRRLDRAEAGRLGGLRSGEIRRAAAYGTKNEADDQANREAFAWSKGNQNRTPSPSPSPKHLENAWSRRGSAKDAPVPHIASSVLDVLLKTLETDEIAWLAPADNPPSDQINDPWTQGVPRPQAVGPVPAATPSKFLVAVDGQSYQGEGLLDPGCAISEERDARENHGGVQPSQCALPPPEDAP